MIDLQHINKLYQRGNVTTQALTDISLSIAEGEFVAIMGPSGCGKSSLLNILGLLDTPTAGDYLLAGKSVAHLNERQLANIRKKQFGYIFQNFNLIDELSVEDNIEMALLYQKMAANERKHKVASVMEKMNIGHRANYFPHEISGGQQQRVAIARAIVANQKIILADEPTGNLDTAHGEEVMQSLQELNQQGSTIVMVTHSAAHADYAKRTINLLDGKLLSQNVKQALENSRPTLRAIG